MVMAHSSSCATGNWAECMCSFNRISLEPWDEATRVCAALPPAGGSTFILGGRERKWCLPAPSFSKKSPSRL